MKITGINHITVNVDGKADEARRFYAEVLGMPLMNHMRPASFKEAIPGDWFALGNERLHVFDYAEGEPLRTPGSPQPGGPHMALHIADLEAAALELDERGIAFWSNGKGADRQLWILDPGGNTIELNQDPTHAGD